VTTWTVEHTWDDPAADFAYSIAPTSTIPPQAWPDPVLNAMIGSALGGIPGAPGWPSVPFASRLTITAGTGLVKMQAIQAGIANF
jgi:hypothetical protein